MATLYSGVSMTILKPRLVTPQKLVTLIDRDVVRKYRLKPQKQVAYLIYSNRISSLRPWLVFDLSACLLISLSEIAALIAILIIARE